MRRQVFLVCGVCKAFPITSDAEQNCRGDGALQVSIDVNQSSSGQVADKDFATLEGCLSFRKVNYVHQYPAGC